MRNLIFLLFILAWSTVVFGQQNKINIGLEGSPSVIFLRGNSFIETFHEPAIGFSGGLSFQYNFHKTLSLKSGIAFERKGSKVSNIGNVNGYSTPFTTHVNFDYLTLPILIRATFGNKINFFCNAGPFLGFLIKQTEVTETQNNPKTTYDNTFRDKRIDAGLTVGLGFSIPIKEKFAISFEIRNNLGLYNVSEVSVINNGTIKTNSTNLLIGLNYKLGIL